MAADGAEEAECGSTWSSDQVDPRYASKHTGPDSAFLYVDFYQTTSRSSRFECSSSTGASTRYVISVRMSSRK